MSEYITREQALTALKDALQICKDTSELEDLFSLELLNAVPVNFPIVEAEWWKTEDGQLYCSHCGKFPLAGDIYPWEQHFCDYCGAKMKH